MAGSIKVLNIPELDIRVPATERFKEFTFTLDEIRQAVEIAAIHVHNKTTKKPSNKKVFYYFFYKI